MKSLMLLWKKVAEESATWCCTSATMDWKTVQVRIEHEGLSFLTITLPTFGKDFQKSLDLGQVDRCLFTGFRFRAGLPQFLGGFLDLVFDRQSGSLLDEPSIDAIRAIRQLTLMFSKILLPASDARTRAAMDSFVECEQDIRVMDRNLSSASKADFKRISALLFRDIFTQVDRDIYYRKMVPSHGPGATADRLRGNMKYDQRAWPARLEKFFPMEEFLIPNASYWEDLERVDVLEPEAELPVRIISVPKTLKTPRIIGIEPTAMQYAQQAIRPLFMHALEKSPSVQNGWPFCGMIGFDDQEPNQLMAREASRHGDLATLDLSEASDRVSNQLVRLMLQDHPWLYGAVDACRSRKADVQGHGVIRLAKFASMGSALTFPIEAMVFLTMIFIGIERDLNESLSRRTIRKLYNGRVRVYGDDIIVPVEHVRSVIGSLETFGSRVGVAKSFWTGRFRESCGGEFYDGHDVTYIKVRREFPESPRQANRVISIVELRNQLYKSGYWQTVRWLDSEIVRVIKYFPVVLESSPVLGRLSFLGFETQRIGRHLHNPQVRGYVVSSELPESILDGHPALTKFFLKRGKLPSFDRKHLERAGRPQSVNTKLRWASAV